MNQKKIGKFISELRKSKDMTQEDLANKLRVSSKSVSRWENGINMPDYSILNSLCNEFDINVLELLNGEKKKSDNKVFEEYMKYKDKVNKRKKILYFIILLLVILLSTLSIYFISNYKNVTVYELTGESDHFYYDSGILLKSNIKYIMQYGKLSIKADSNITEKDIMSKGLVYKKDNDYYSLTSFKNDALIKENYGYSEIFNLSNIEYIPNELYIIVFYKSGDEVKHEELKINAEEIMKNDKLINLRNKFISEKNNQEKVDFNKYDKGEKYKQFLLDNGFSQNTHLWVNRGSNFYTKIIDKYGQLDFSYYTGNCSYYYRDDTLEIMMTHEVDYENKDRIWNHVMVFTIKDLKNHEGHKLAYDLNKNEIQENHNLINKYSNLKTLIENVVNNYKKYRMENIK